ncbi:MAG TPA: DUF58 domain-containing protein [Gaiellaceae bacterium]|nr:DUF58 domain-containing protein [Gaiellaceae bacterium]
MTTAAPETIPLHPRRRLIGTASGGSASIRRGGRSDVASSRPYRPGDHFRTIDWKASARLSSAQNHDEFIVRERHADEMPAVVIVVDRRPGMGLYPAELPWLHKPEAVRAIVDILVASAVNQRSLVGYLDHTTWQPPRAQASVWSQGVEERIDEHLADGFDAPDDALDRALEDLALRRPSLPIGSFVFVVSDFLQPVPHERWSQAVTRGWDVIPVIVQDPVWEQSFPEIDGVLVTVTDAIGGHESRVRLGPREVAERRARHEQRLASIRDDFVRLGLDPILIGSTDHVHERLLEWAHARIDVARGPR